MRQTRMKQKINTEISKVQHYYMSGKLINKWWQIKCKCHFNTVRASCLPLTLVRSCHPICDKPHRLRIGTCVNCKYYVTWLLTLQFSAVAANAAMLLMNANSNGGPPMKKFITPNSIDLAELASNAAASGEVSFPRRERFVFRPNHLEILERYFQDNNYPSYETRDEIAQACNAVTENVGESYLNGYQIVGPYLF